MGVEWKWLKPVVEMLVLAELLGVVVLERRQLFEPIHETVEAIQSRTEDLYRALDASTHATLYANLGELIRALTRATREALARDHDAPQILRSARLASCYTVIGRDRQLLREVRDWINAVAEYCLRNDTHLDSRNCDWKVQIVLAVPNVNVLDEEICQILRITEECKPLNEEVKLLVRQQVQAALSPTLIIDRETTISFDNGTAAFQWGVAFQGA